MARSLLAAQVEALDLKDTNLLIVRGIPVDEEDDVGKVLVVAVPHHVRILFAPLDFRAEQLDDETMGLLGWVRK